MDEKLRVVKPYGHLYTMDQDYFLLKPYSIPGDSWEGDNCYRFLVTPTVSEAMVQKGSEIYPVFGYARHIVTNAFTIEYMDDIHEIHIINEVGYKSNTKEIVENDEEDEFPF